MASCKSPSVINNNSSTSNSTTVKDPHTADEDKIQSKLKHQYDASLRRSPLLKDCHNSSTQRPSKLIDAFNLPINAAKQTHVYQEKNVTDTPTKRQYPCSDEDFRSQPDSKKQSTLSEWNHKTQNYKKILSILPNLLLTSEMTSEDQFSKEFDRIFNELYKENLLPVLEESEQLRNVESRTDFLGSSTDRNKKKDLNKTQVFKKPEARERRRGKTPNVKTASKSANKQKKMKLKDSKCKAAEKVEIQRSQTQNEGLKDNISLNIIPSNENWLNTGFESELDIKFLCEFQDLSRFCALYQFPELYHANRGSRNDTGEISRSRNYTEEVSRSRNDTEEVSRSRNGSVEISQNGTEEISRNGTEEISLYRDDTAENPLSRNDTGEVSRSRNDMGEVSRSRNDTGEVSRTKNDMGEVSRSRNDTGEVSRSRNDTGEVSRSRNNTEEMSRNYTKEISLYRNDTTDNFRSRNGTEENPLSLNGTEENPQSLNGTEENPRSLNSTAKNLRPLIRTEENPRSRNDTEKVSRSRNDTEKKTRSRNRTEENHLSRNDSEKISRSRNDVGKISRSQSNSGEEFRSQKDSGKSSQFRNNIEKLSRTVEEASQFVNHSRQVSEVEVLVNQRHVDHLNSLEDKEIEKLIFHRLEALENQIHYWYCELCSIPPWSPKLVTVLQHLARRRSGNVCDYLAKRYNSQRRRPLSEIRERFIEVLETLGYGMINILDDIRYMLSDGNIREDDSMIGKMAIFWKKIEDEYVDLFEEFCAIRDDYPNFFEVCASMGEHFLNVREIFFTFQECIVDLFESF